MQPVTLLIVDDHEMVRAGLRTLLREAPGIDLVGEADGAASALEALHRIKPAVVLLDLRLGDGSGVDVCRDIKKRWPEVRVLILTSYPDEQAVMDCIAAGADGYLLKEVNREGMLSAIQRVATGQSVLDPALTGRVFGKIQAGAQNRAGNKLCLLSPQELRVVELVAQGLTNKEIGDRLRLSEKTVKNYFSNLLEKLAMDRRAQVAAYYVQHSKTVPEWKPCPSGSTETK
jgi:DNA-binding NarL/FixJ family response regulator